MDTARAASHLRALVPGPRSTLGPGLRWGEAATSPFLPVSEPYYSPGLTHQVTCRPLRGSLSRQPTPFSSLRVSAAHDDYSGEGGGEKAPLRQLRRSAPDLAADVGDEPGFRVIPRRWIVERTFSWISRQRCMSKDDERQAGSAEAFIALVGIRLLLARLTRR
jgi:transposase